MALSTDREKCAHLLRRFGLGASESELDYYLASGGYTGAVAKLLDYDSVDEGFSFDVTDMKAGGNQVVNMPGVVSWWALRMMATRRPLQEKMTLFWHDHFATSASKVNGPLLMHAQNEILRKNATGDFRTLLGEVSKDPAMLIWLDNVENVAGKPNENFAREVMELFTLGIGHYTEHDIQEAARAFTGWGIQRLPRFRAVEEKKQAVFSSRPKQHDTGSKTILGSTGDFDGDDVLDLLCAQPRTADYITQKIWEWFVYPNPDPSTLARYSKVFRDSKLNIKELLRSIMLSPEFVSPKAERAIIKNPVDFVVVTMRQLGIGEIIAKNLAEHTAGEDAPRTAVAPGFLVQTAMKSMGMWLMYPPDVSGWDGGQAWISSATMVERMKWADKLFTRYPTYSLFRDDPSPQNVVKRLVSIFDVPLKPEKQKALIEAAAKTAGGNVTQTNAATTATQVAKLIFASPEFQFS